MPGTPIRLHFDRQGDPAAAAARMGDSHSILWLNQAELDRLTVEDDLAADRYVKKQQFAFDEHGRLSIDRIHVMNYPDAA